MALQYIRKKKKSKWVLPFFELHRKLYEIYSITCKKINFQLNKCHLLNHSCVFFLLHKKK